MPPYVNSTAQITITGVSSTASSKRRRLQATSGSADVTTEFDLKDAHTVAGTGTQLASVISNSKFLVSLSPCCCYVSCIVTETAQHLSH